MGWMAIRQRLLAAELLAQGHSPTFVARAVGVHARTIAKWTQGDPYVKAHAAGKRQQYLDAIEGVAGIAMRELEAQLLDAEATNADRARAASIIMGNRNRAIQAAASTMAAESIERQSLHPDTYRERRAAILAELQAIIGVPLPDVEDDE